MPAREGTRETIVDPVQRRNLAIRRYEEPPDLPAAVFLISQTGERPRFKFGGTDLLLELQSLDRPGVDTLIDISRIAALDQIRLDTGFVRLGAGVAHNQEVRSEFRIKRGPPLAQVWWEIGSPQLRNRATVVGNIVTATGVWFDSLPLTPNRVVEGLRKHDVVVAGHANEPRIKDLQTVGMQRGTIRKSRFKEV